MRHESQPMTLVLCMAQKSANVNIYIFCSNSHKTKRLVYTEVKRQILYKSADRFKRSFKSIWNTYLPWQLTTFAWLQIIMTLEYGRKWRPDVLGALHIYHIFGPLHVKPSMYARKIIEENQLQKCACSRWIYLERDRSRSHQIWKLKQSYLLPNRNHTGCFF